MYYLHCLVFTFHRRAPRSEPAGNRVIKSVDKIVNGTDYYLSSWKMSSDEPRVVVGPGDRDTVCSPFGVTRLQH